MGWGGVGWGGVGWGGVGPQFLSCSGRTPGSRGKGRDKLGGRRWDSAVAQCEMNMGWDNTGGRGVEIVG